VANFGFVIDNRSCIGCHACSTACKSENEVPLGVYRTWVKSTETGEWPDTQRHFQVTRCNHCANPPCVRICPTQAMYQRDDGIVEFDNEMCIGCKACMQACPYDAIHIDPETSTAAKCHYCSHRTDRGLEPACVVVCPTHAIISGDMDDPASEISRVLAREKVSVRKPEQGTAPKLFYVDGAAVNLVPTATERTPESFVWADVEPLHGEAVSDASLQTSLPGESRTGVNRRGVPMRAPESQGLPAGGPIQIGGGRVAEHMVQVAYNAQHKVPWHWPVPAYLVSKAIGSGVFLVAVLLWFLGQPFHVPTALGVGLVSVIGMLVTTGLLVLDLERPERFLYVLFRPQYRSWLARGALGLVGFSTISGLWWIVELGESMGWVSGWADPLRVPLLLAGCPLALLTAVYTAFLFSQAEGRDLWQSPLLPIHMLLQAATVGAGVLLAIGVAVGAPDGFLELTRLMFAVLLAVDLAITLLGDVGMSHASEVAARAAHDISHGRYARQFWMGSVLIGHVLPIGFLLSTVAWMHVGATLAAIAGLYWYEHAFVMAPQDVPNS
jgi:Fe-S-cluster-containing dehydrogenase component/formate-dependent nitrite reductase membrane component NrfD